MKAKIQSRLTENHLKLGDVLPLESPFVLLVDPSNLCNFKCKFCPTGDHELIRQTKRKQGILDFDLFKKIIDDLDEFNNPIKVLRLYKEGEPLINPNFSKMIKYAKDSNKVLRIDTTTNGALLNPKLNRQIIEAGIDQINISVNGVSSELKYVDTKINFENYYENISDLYKNKGNCEIFIKAIKQNLSESEQKTFLDIFGSISDKIYLENISPAWPQFKLDEISTEFNSGHYGQPITQKNVCPYIFYIMVINSDGTTSLCVGDWKHKLSYGDVKNQSVKSIWDGEILKSHHISHLEGKRINNDICKACQVISHGTIENIDEFAQDILNRMKK